MKEKLIDILEIIIHYVLPFIVFIGFMYITDTPYKPTEEELAEKQAEEEQREYEELSSRIVFVLKEEIYLEYAENYNNVQYHEFYCPVLEVKDYDEYLPTILLYAADNEYKPCPVCTPPEL